MTTPAWISPRKQGPPRGGRSATEAATPSQDQRLPCSIIIIVHVSSVVLVLLYRQHISPALKKKKKRDVGVKILNNKNEEERKR